MKDFDETSYSTRCSLVFVMFLLLAIFVAVRGQTYGLDCPTSNFPQFNNSRVISYVINQYIVYQCLDGFQYDNNTDGILWCNRTTGTWAGSPGICRQIDFCNPNPCFNGGSCSTAEDPFNVGYYCACPGNFGGKRCQIDSPCITVPCPPSGIHCYRSFADDSGRFCYDSNYNRVQ